MVSCNGFCEPTIIKYVRGVDLVGDEVDGTSAKQRELHTSASLLQSLYLFLPRLQICLNFITFGSPAVIPTDREFRSAALTVRT